jgi:hypothetical protein
VQYALIASCLQALGLKRFRKLKHLRSVDIAVVVTVETRKTQDLKKAATEKS